jgi:hypothetical protein
MYGIDADGWLAVHHVEHRELMERAERAGLRAALRPAIVRPVPAVPTPIVPASAAPVCC